MNEPVAWLVDNQAYIIKEAAESLSRILESPAIPLYTNPKKYCPSENNSAYEKGFIDGMAKMTESAVHRAVEGMAVKELTNMEIMDIGDKYLVSAFIPSEALEFARAILRKAQEK